ncbi:MAG TPA: SURF1 family protein [Cycloclasticus sp.]|nr:SURF1 family protein [Cycloclasticus sp.]
MQFKANVFLSMLAILVLCLLLSLGNWQLDRAQEKKDLLDLQHIRMNLDPVELPTIEMENGNVRYLPVKLTGWMDTKQQILIDNQVRNGQAGYFVLTPVKLENGLAILLNRGWVPPGNSRTDLPNIELQSQNIAVAGKLDHFPSVGIKLEGADRLSVNWPAVTQVVNLENVEKRLGYSVLPYQVLLDSVEPNGYDREWVPMHMGPEKHHGYAFQWFALSAAWVVIYLVLTIKFKRREE